MLISAQYVTTADHATSGTNVFLCFHGEPLPGDFEKKEVAEIVDEFPGILVTERREVSAGGNPILAYIDIVGPDDANPSDLKHVFEGLAEDLHPVLASHQKLDTLSEGRTFRADYRAPRRSSVPPHVMLSRLRDAMFSLFDEVARSGWRARTPLVIYQRRDESATRFELPDVTLETLRAAEPDKTIPRSLTVSHEVAELMSSAGILPLDVEALSSSLTHRDMAALLPLGGLELRKTDDELLYRWPARGATTR